MQRMDKYSSTLIWEWISNYTIYPLFWIFLLIVKENIYFQRNFQQGADLGIDKIHVTNPERLHYFYEIYELKIDLSCQFIVIWCIKARLIGLSVCTAGVDCINHNFNSYGNCHLCNYVLSSL